MARFLEEVVNIAETCNLVDHDGITRETALLGLRVAAHNGVSHAALDDLVADICAYVDAQPRIAQSVSIPERARAVIERMTLAGCFAASLNACGGTTDDGGQPGATGGATGTNGTRNTGGYMILDPVPPTGGAGGAATTANTGGYLVYDMAPPTGGRANTGGNPATGGRIAGDGGAPAGGKASGGTMANVGAGTSTGGSNTGGYMIADPLPPTGGRTSTGGTGSTIVYFDNTGGASIGGSASSGGSSTGGYQNLGGGDSVPSSGGRLGTGGQASGGFIVDCVVSAGGKGSSIFASAVATPDPKSSDEGALACTVDPAPPQCSPTAPKGHAVVENWRDSGPQRLVRSTDIALFDPPNLRLKANHEAGRVRVHVQSDESTLTYRWESEGRVEGNGEQVYWTPAHGNDALCVAVRGQGGVAVATLRAGELPHS